MSSLVLMVAVAAAPGIGPEMASAEVQRDPFAGEWEGVLQAATLDDLRMTMVDGQLFLEWPMSGTPCGHRMTPLGEGRLRVLLDEGEYLGIYQEVGGRLVICLRGPDDGWPSSFRLEKGRQGLLTLRRAKPRE